MVNRGPNQNMALIKNKRGIFFTALVLVIITLFLLSYTFFTQVDERKTIQKRVETLNSFMNSLEKDIPRQLKASGFRIILLLENRIIETGEYTEPSVQFRFNETFYTGTVYGETNDEIQELLEGMTLAGIQENINAKAAKINARVIMSNTSITVTQVDPWHIRVALDAEYSIQDKSGLVSWNKTTPYVALIPIETLEDPIYPVESNNPGVINRINRTTYQGFNSSDELLDHAANSYYLWNTDAPSFLDRMEGNIAANSVCCGIESLVSGALTDASVGLSQGKSIVDHVYFTDGGSSNSVPNGITELWFLIDSNHYNVYIITS